MKDIYQTVIKNIGYIKNGIKDIGDILYRQMKNRNKESDPILASIEKAVENATERILIQDKNISIRKLKYDPFAR